MVTEVAPTVYKPARVTKTSDQAQEQGGQEQQGRGGKWFKDPRYDHYHPSESWRKDVQPDPHPEAKAKPTFNGFWYTPATSYRDYRNAHKKTRGNHKVDYGKVFPQYKRRK